MIPNSRALVSLNPARQAAIQAISHVELSRERGSRLPALPSVRTFLRLLTGSGRLNATVARQIPGLHWVPKNRHSNLKQVEEALDTMIATGGEACPLPLNGDVQAELFPEVMHTRTDEGCTEATSAPPASCAANPVKLISNGGCAGICLRRPKRN